MDDSTSAAVCGRNDEEDNKNVCWFSVDYNIRDLILYALSLGFGSSSSSALHDNIDDDIDDELRYLYEHSKNFVAVPTFCLALLFWANQNRHDNNNNNCSKNIPPFPPPMMKTANEQFLKRFVKKEEEDDDKDETTRSLSDYPILHIRQSITWHCTEFPVPTAIDNDSGVRDADRNDHNGTIRVHLKEQIIQVLPKSIGTFLTSETKIYRQQQQQQQQHLIKTDELQLLCTLQSTSLIFGLPQEYVHSFQDPKYPIYNKAPTLPPNKQKNKDYDFSFEWVYATSPIQALFYRLTSGDSNRIHVEQPNSMLAALLSPGGDEDEESDTTRKKKKKKRPILHGLCTLGIAVRAILQYTSAKQGKNNVHFKQLMGSFTKPVFVGDVVCVQIKMADHYESKINNNTRHLSFVVLNQSTNEKAIDHGYAEIIVNDATTITTTKRSKL